MGLVKQVATKNDAGRKKQVEWKCPNLHWIVHEDPEIFWVSNKKAHPKAWAVMLDDVSEPL